MERSQGSFAFQLDPCSFRIRPSTVPLQDVDPQTLGNVVDPAIDHTSYPSADHRPGPTMKGSSDIQVQAPRLSRGDTS